MRKSRSEAAKTREKIVAVASQVFLDKGLGTVGMRDVMKAAGLTAGGFYRHFSSKDELITEAIRAAFDRLFAMFEREIEGKPGSEALARISTLYLQQSRDRSSATALYLCPLAQLGSELRHATSAVQAIAIDGHGRFISLIARCLSELPPDEAAARATTIVSLLIGAVTLAGLSPDSKAASHLLRQAKLSILRQA